MNVEELKKCLANLDCKSFVQSELTKTHGVQGWDWDKFWSMLPQVIDLVRKFFETAVKT